jgi:hypothetical protein
VGESQVSGSPVARWGGFNFEDWCSRVRSFMRQDQIATDIDTFNSLLDTHVLKFQVQSIQLYYVAINSAVRSSLPSSLTANSVKWISTDKTTKKRSRKCTCELHLDHQP